MSQDGERKAIKVTDKRMFTEDGELREEFSHLDEEAPSVSATRSDSPESAPPGPESPEPSVAESASTQAGGPQPAGETGGPTRSAESVNERPSDQPPAGAGQGEVGGSQPDLGPGGFAGVGFVDLVAMLAEPVALFLGDASMPDGSSVEDLPRARAHIDLLAVLKEKTEGNLSAEEDAVLSDLLYRLQMRYVQKAGA